MNSKRFANIRTITEDGTVTAYQVLQGKTALHYIRVKKPGDAGRRAALRAALTLRNASYEETGVLHRSMIVAPMTGSVRRLRFRDQNYWSLYYRNPKTNAPVSRRLLVAPGAQAAAQRILQLKVDQHQAVRLKYDEFALAQALQYAQQELDTLRPKLHKFDRDETWQRAAGEVL